jgi:N-methylhydantoinase B/oxoprolinase/acetone carboxylase alpha subunit
MTKPNILNVNRICIEDRREAKVNYLTRGPASGKPGNLQLRHASPKQHRDVIVMDREVCRPDRSSRKTSSRGGYGDISEEKTRRKRQGS